MEFIVLSFQKSLHAAERQPGDWGWVSGWGDTVFVCSDVNGGVNTLGYLVSRARRQGFRWKIRRLLKPLFKSGLPFTWQFPARKLVATERLEGLQPSLATGRLEGLLLQDGHTAGGRGGGPLGAQASSDMRRALGSARLVPTASGPGERVGVPLGGKVWVVCFQSPMLNYGRGQGPWARLTWPLNVPQAPLQPRPFMGALPSSLLLCLFTSASPR